MPAMHLKGRTHSPNTGQTQQVHNQYQQYQGHPAPTLNVVQPAPIPIVVQGLQGWELLVSFLINIMFVVGGMSVVGYFGWNFTLLGLGGIFRVDLYHAGPMWTFDSTHDLNIGLHHLIPLTVSLIEWRYMPYEFYVRWRIGFIKVYLPRRKVLAPVEGWQSKLWWLNMILFDVGPTYGGIALFFAAGVVFPLPGINLALATAGTALVIQSLITAGAFSFAPEPVIRGALKQFGKDTGLW